MSTCLVGSPAWTNVLVIAGVGLFVSDMVHHFLVLWPLTGTPEFHIKYAIESAVAAPFPQILGERALISLA